MDSLKNDRNLSDFHQSIELINSEQSKHGGRVYIGYSGGMDSSVLLHLCKDAQIPNLYAIHVNHQLQRDADAWQAHCQQQCQMLGVPIVTLSVKTSPQQGESIEAFARNARYQLIEEQLQAGDLFISAHHQQDQAETFLLQLMRGAGLDGLKSMPQLKPLGKGHYLRPLLNVSKQAITNYTTTHLLSYIADPSNADTRFARSFLRSEVIPLLESRWPSACQSIATSAQWLQEIEPPQPPQQLYVGKLVSLSESEQKQQIRTFIKAKLNYSLSSNETAYIQNHFLTAEIDKHPQLNLGDYQLRRHQGELVLIKQLPETAVATDKLTLSEISETQTSQLNELLKINWQSGCGIDFSQLKRDVIHIKPVTGSTRFHPYGRTNSQTLKKLLLEQQIPVWLRPFCYGLYADNELLAVLGVGVSRQHYQTGVNCYLPQWQIASEFVSI